MQIKINFLCRDSILAAPLCLDLVLLSDLAARAGRFGIQRFLSFFLKSPMHDFTENETERFKRDVVGIAISKIEEFASILDDTVDTTA